MPLTAKVTEKMQNNFETFSVLGVPITVTNLDEAAKTIASWKNDRRGRAVGVRDVASTMLIHADPALLAVSQRTVMNVPDGMPLVWIGKHRGFAVERTCGPDLMEKIMLDSTTSGLKHFFYGGKEGVANKLANHFRNRKPGIEIVGTYYPPFRALTAEEDANIVEMINTSGADIVWVGISSPKQDIWMDEHLSKISCTMIGVGAAFDFHLGSVQRAPVWMQRNGLEWLHRLYSEPRRLWHRYLVLAPKFVWKVFRDHKHFKDK